MKIRTLTLILIVSICKSYAQTALIDTSKNVYTLFKPVPKGRMRNMETDRPGMSESPYSVDAGHFQLETDAFKMIINEMDGVKTRDLEYNRLNIKAGITNHTDIQFVVPFYQEKRTKTVNGKEQIEDSSSFEEVTIRVKHTVWGNDKGSTALALLPFVTLPTTKGERITGGLAVPFATKLKNKFSLGAQLDAQYEKDESDEYDTQISNSYLIERELPWDFEVFLETYNSYALKAQHFDSFLNGGLVYSIGNNFNLDAGLHYGITDNSKKEYYLGISFRY
ncbi:MAG: transporter [Daejeonella sp.]|nr:transporter [Daejeonella sp.]